MSVPRRRCSRCGKEKPLTRRYFYARKSGGFDYWCRVCKCAVSKAARDRQRTARYKQRAGVRLNAYEQRDAAAAERDRQAKAEYMRRKRADPVWTEERREYNRQVMAWRRSPDNPRREENLDKRRIDYWLRKDGDREHAPASGRTHYRRPLGQDEHLDVEPFAQWIEETFNESAVEVAYFLGIAEREVRRTLDREVPTISLRLVDKAFVRFGRPDLLNSLYPLEERATA